VDVLGQGARVFGSGGGGDPEVACASLRQALKHHSRVEVITPDALAPTAQVVPFGFVGATSLLSERLPSGAEIIDAWAGASAAAEALIPLEIGGFNGVAAVWAAAILGVPLVDADLMGRALPGLHQLLPITRGWEPCPAVVIDVHRRKLVLDHMEAPMLESIVRTALTAMGGWAVMACQPLAAGSLADCCHPGTVSRAMHLGADVERLLAGHNLDETPALSGTMLGEGRVIEITRGGPRPGRRMPVTTLVVDLAGSAAGVLRLEAESEWLAVVVDGEPVATVPDLVMVWDIDSREALAVETVRHGRNVQVTALPGSPAWWRPEALPRVEPAAFGLDIPPRRTASAT
jgi:uncharacterized protein